MNMGSTLRTELEGEYQGKLFLTVEDVSKLLSCTTSTVKNWTRRPDPRKRPPQIRVGKSIRFPKILFLDWVVTTNLGRIPVPVGE